MLHFFVLTGLTSSALQIHYYQEILAHNYDLLHRNRQGAARASLVNICMQLRKVGTVHLSCIRRCPCRVVTLFKLAPTLQVCNHPFVIPGVEENTIRDANLPLSVNRAMVDPRIHALLVQSSGKLQVRISKPQQCVNNGERACVCACVCAWSRWRVVLTCIGAAAGKTPTPIEGHGQPRAAVQSVLRRP